MQKKIFITILVLLLLGLQSRSATYYLDAAVADDSQDGTTWVKAKKTWNAGGADDMDSLLDGLDDDGAGDTVDVNDGSYGDWTGGTLIRARTDTLTIQAASGASPDINSIAIASGANTDVYLIFDGFNVLDGVNAQNPNHVQFLNCYIRTVDPSISGVQSTYIRDSAYGIKIYDACDWTIDSCEFEYCCRGVSATGTTSNITITNCEIHYCSEAGIISTGTDQLIENNYVYDLIALRSPENIFGTNTENFIVGETVTMTGTAAEGIVYSSAESSLKIYETTSDSMYQRWIDNEDGSVIGGTSEANVPEVTKIDPYHADCVFVRGDGTVTRNVLVRAFNGGEDGQVLKLDRFDGAITNNLCIGNKPLLTGGNDNCIINNNHFIGAYFVMIYGGSGGTGENCIIAEMYNNVFVAGLNFEADAGGFYSRVISHGNNLFSNDPCDDGGPAYPFDVNEATEIVDVNFADGTYFVSFDDDTTNSSNNYRSKAGSGIINTANATYAPAVDIDNISRGEEPDLGAYEYMQYLVAWLRKEN